VDVAARPAAVPLPPAAFRRSRLAPVVLAAVAALHAAPADAALLPPPQRLPRLFGVPEWDAGRCDIAPLRTAAAGDIRIVPGGSR
jgi:hypothetical protein